MLKKSVYHERIESIQKWMLRDGFDVAILTPSPNFQYLAGYSYEMRERLVALILQPESPPKLLVPFFELSDHEKNTWIENIETWNEDEDPYLILKNMLQSGKEQYRLMLDDLTPMSVFWALKTALGDFPKLESIAPLITKMRIEKSDVEIDKMKDAGRIIDKAVMETFREIFIGQTELQVKQILSNKIVELGGQPTFFAVQFGERSAMPHASPSKEKLTKGDVVLIDCGCSIDGYNTDMTRVAIAGETTTEIENVYELVLKAEKTAINEIRAGMQCGTADGIARKIIDEGGYGEFFTHRLGHGIGLEVHEPPYIVRGNSLELTSGMTHSVEPGIYLNGNFGIRIEDLVCIHEDRTELLTYSDRELFQID